MVSQVWALQRLIVVFLAVAIAMAGGLARFGSPAAAQDESNRARASVTFTELNDSGLSGTAELTCTWQADRGVHENQWCGRREPNTHPHWYLR